ncbi:hypothetical protein K491DRAFT_419779 [Lophiostoma macrostomum CBS 122681]|uniref:Uncharacterized protein n=1 Tax=Lophiostoma macrostomum CBS 122681 TaxID=1314788 RepID=A0A6A6TPA0_9PLEO|nr:hypothetical protein K491DRAFT_419779 [Lophiostoma macrostomum CBS 122681]
MTFHASGCPGHAMFVCSLQPPAQPHDSTQPHDFPDSKSVPGLQERKNSHYKLNTLSHSTFAPRIVDILTSWSQLRSDQSLQALPTKRTLNSRPLHISTPINAIGTKPTARSLPSFFPTSHIPLSALSDCIPSQPQLPALREPQESQTEQTFQSG